MRARCRASCFLVSQTAGSKTLWGLSAPLETRQHVGSGSSRAMEHNQSRSSTSSRSGLPRQCVSQALIRDVLLGYKSTGHSQLFLSFPRGGSKMLWGLSPPLETRQPFGPFSARAMEHTQSRSSTSARSGLPRNCFSQAFVRGVPGRL